MGSAVATAGKNSTGRSYGPVIKYFRFRAGPKYGQVIKRRPYLQSVVILPAVFTANSLKSSVISPRASSLSRGTDDQFFYMDLFGLFVISLREVHVLFTRGYRQ